MISQHVFARVFHIRCGSKHGTAFLGTFEGEEYFITADHLISAYSESCPVEYEHQETWHSVPVELLGRGTSINKEFDVAVFKWRGSQIKSESLPLDPNGAFVSDDAYFLGYPYTMASDPQALGGWSMALVKKSGFLRFR
jgi:hypothetical protein